MTEWCAGLNLLLLALPHVFTGPVSAQPSARSASVSATAHTARLITPVKCDATADKAASGGSNVTLAEAKDAYDWMKAIQKG